MKYFLILFTLLILLGSKVPIPPKTISLIEAVNQNLIQLNVIGNVSSPHYSKPIKIELKSLSTSPFIVKIPNGQRFITLDSTVQDMIVVKSEQLALAPGYKKSIELNAMCTQRQNQGPRENEPYKLGPLAKTQLSQVANKIEEIEAFNTVGQYAIWTISNNLGLEQIAGFNDNEAEELQKFVAQITGKQIPEKDTTDYSTNYNRTTITTRTVGGKFEYGLVKPSNITIGLFTEDNIIARELLNKPNTPRGDHELNFEFDMAVYNDPIYFVRLIIDGEIKLSYKIET